MQTENEKLLRYFFQQIEKKEIPNLSFRMFVTIFLIFYDTTRPRGASLNPPAGLTAPRVFDIDFSSVFPSLEIPLMFIFCGQLCKDQWLPG